MARASESQKAERLNRARDLLLHVDQLSDAVEQLAQDCTISPRQAYRYPDFRTSPGSAGSAELYLVCLQHLPCEKGPK